MDWKSLGVSLALVILFGVLITLAALVVVSILARNAPCKSNETCPVGQTCDLGSGYCKSLPGSSCINNSQCSHYAPICATYCTNDASQPRGTSGNPPRTGSGAPCDAGLIVNSVVNLCQQLSIGAPCNMDAQCNQGLCDQGSKTCQYATSHCTTDTSLNPMQCAPTYECNAQSLVCTLQGSTPGGDGAPCTSNADCAIGSTCILPPGGAGQGVCHSGLATWLLLLGELPGEDRCMAPLSEGTGWCRYDVKDFMRCTNSLQCAYPYAQCIGSNVCDFSPGVTDPIQPAKFPYFPVGFNAPSTGVTGAFYTASFPLPQPPAENPTGGKLIDQYLGFTPVGQQLPTFMNRSIFSFSSLTSYTITSLAPVADPPHPPQIPYYTAIFEDPNPAMVDVSIIPLDAVTAELWFTIRSADFVLDPAKIGELSSVDARVWNPWAVAQADSTVSTVHFISNPIITPWIDITQGPFAPPPQSFMIHTLVYSDGHYVLGFLARLASQSSPIFPSALLTPTINGNPLTPNDLLVTSWDAITTWVQRALPINTTVIMYGYSRSSGAYFMGVAQIAFISTSNGLLTPQVTTGPNEIPIFFKPVPINMATFTTQCHLTRAVAQTVEPLLTLAIFFIVPEGLQVSMFVVNSTDGQIDLSSTKCAKAQTLKDVSSLLAVTPVTGAYNWGSFVVWCSTAQTRRAFLVVQTNAQCPLVGGTNQMDAGLIYSAVYWRRLTGDPPDDYWLYPIGGASLPYFLATTTPLTFDGVP